MTCITQRALSVGKIPERAGTVDSLHTHHPFGRKRAEPRVVPSPIKAEWQGNTGVCMTWIQTASLGPSEFVNVGIAVKSNCMQSRGLCMGIQEQEQEHMHMKYT